MATLTLTRVWVNLLPTGQAVSGVSGRGRGRAYDQAGDVRTYAGGRQRAVTVAGTRGQFTFTLRLISPAAVDTLISWIGRTVQVRDHGGQRYFGVYHSVVPTEYMDPARWDATIVLHVVTTPEGV